MDVSSSLPVVDVGLLQDPAGLASSPNRSPAALAREFEGLFVSVLMKQMRETLSEGLFPGDSSDTLGGLFDMQIAQHISQSGGMGLADVLEKYIATSLRDSGN